MIQIGGSVLFGCFFFFSLNTWSYPWKTVLYSIRTSLSYISICLITGHFLHILFTINLFWRCLMRDLLCQGKNMIKPKLDFFCLNWAYATVIQDAYTSQIYKLKPFADQQGKLLLSSGLVQMGFSGSWLGFVQFTITQKNKVESHKHSQFTMHRSDFLKVWFLSKMLWLIFVRQLSLNESSPTKPNKQRRQQYWV